jgi:hypothetical protein
MSARRTLRRLAGASLLSLAAGATAIGASGCGSTSVSNVIDPVAKAATQSSSASGYRMAIAMTMSSTALPTPITATGSGTFDVPGRQGSMTMNMSFGSNPAIASALGGSGTLTMTELIKGETIYMRMPDALAGKLPGGKPWIKLDLAAIGKAAGVTGLSGLLGPGTSNPAQMLQYLRAVSGGVTKVGTERVGQVRTTHYRGVVSLDRYPQLLPSSQRGAAEQAVKQLERLAQVHDMPIDAWVDGHDLVRRIHMSFDEKLPSGQDMNADYDITIPDYGPQAEPVFPPEQSVTDLGALLGSLGG